MTPTTQTLTVKGQMGLEAVVDKDETCPQMLQGPHPTPEPQPQPGLVLLSTILYSLRSEL